MKIQVTQSRIRQALAVVLFPTVIGTMIGSSLAAISRNEGKSLKPLKPLATAVQQIDQTAETLHDQQLKILFHDTTIARNWGLDETKAWDAWKLSRGSRDIVVAVIDTGIDTQHPDLQANLWQNPGETGLDSAGRDKATNGIDDDGNGFIDDVHGWNFVDDNADLTDHHGHGTHIAGIIGASSEKGEGVNGIAPKVSLMAIKYYDPKALDLNPLANTIKAIRYATKMGAKIINYSGGGLKPNSLEFEAIREASEKGILFVAAAGNEKSNSDIKGYYPADYNLPNILSVTAIDINQRILPTSNYGKRSVDIAAPGDDIYSTLPGGDYGSMTGTSQATAFATGVAVLAMAGRPELTQPAKLIEHLIETGEKGERLLGKTRKQTVLNSYRALAIFDRNVAAFGETAENAALVDKSAFTAGN